MIPEVTILEDYSGEWAALYIEGQLMEQGHSISAYDLSMALQARGLISFVRTEVEMEDCFPDSIPDEVRQQFGLKQ